MHILRNRPQTLSHVFYVDGEPTAVSSGNVTYTVTKADGTTLTSGTASASGSTYSFTLAAQTNLNVLKVTWTGTFTAGARSEVDYHEIVGAHLWSWGQLETFDGGTLADVSVDVVEEERVRIHNDLEKWTGVGWIPRFRRHLAEGDRGRELVLPHHPINTVFSASVSGVSQTVSDITVFSDTGKLYHETSNWGWPSSTYPQNVVVEYEYGYEYPRDGVDRIGLLLLKERVVGSDVPTSAVTFSDEFGTYRLDRGHSRNPEVNQWVEDHTIRLPVF